MNISEAIQKLFPDLKEMMPIICKVESVDRVNNLCDAIPVDGSAKVEDARLSIDSNEEKRAVLFPKVGSFICVIFTIDDTPIVIGFSEIEEIDFFTGSANLNLTKDGLSLSNNGQDLLEILTDFLERISKILTTLQKFQLLTNMGPTISVSPQIIVELTQHDAVIKQLLTGIKTVLK